MEKSETTQPLHLHLYFSYITCSDIEHTCQVNPWNITWKCSVPWWMHVEPLWIV